jgi:hypothetical protein
VEITWPSGQCDTLHNLKANATYVIEGGGDRQRETVQEMKPFSGLSS